MRFLANLHHLSDWGLLALRAGVGMSFWAHGTAKRAMWKMAPSPQMPAGLLSTLRVLSIVEPLGAIAAFAGFLMQPAAVGFVIIMLGAIRLKAVQMRRGFSADGGWELDFLLLTAAVALFFLGAGAISIDRLLFGL
jgi:putative oxidoreductase